jgi:hypothetical protein
MLRYALVTMDPHPYRGTVEPENPYASHWRDLRRRRWLLISSVVAAMLTISALPWLGKVGPPMLFAFLIFYSGTRFWTSAFNCPNCRHPFATPPPAPDLFPLARKCTHCLISLGDSPSGPWLTPKPETAATQHSRSK